MTAVVLGVAGGSGSGKTTVARAILDTVGRNRIAFIAQDSYYRAVDWASPQEARLHNFDHPAAIDHELLIEHVRELRDGREVAAPVYDFVHHRRLPEAQTVEARPVVLLEGILLFVERELRDLLDFKIFVDTDSDIRLIRRLRRDIADRGRHLDDVLSQYEKTVRPMHQEFVEPSKRWADVIIPEGGENQVALAMVIARVEQLLQA